MDKSKLREAALSDLRLDPENPRLPKYVERDQDSMFEFLAKSSSIDELMSAISENGFFEAEALIAVPNDDGSLCVVEGNRRLTALLLLSGKTYPGITQRITSLQSEAKHRPAAVPVYVFEKRSEILNYLGNRHIAGVKAWGALAKARYIRQIFNETDEKQDFGDRCRTTARIIGSRRDFISRTLRALSVFEIAEHNDYFGLKGVDESVVKFSLISTAIDYEGISSFLFPSTSEDETPASDEPPSTDNIKLFFSWLFEKNEKQTTLLGESRNIHKLSKVVASTEGLEAIKKGADLEQAYLLTTGVEEDFDIICNNVQRLLREANSLVSDVEITPSREEIVESIFKQARTLKRSLEDE